MAPTCDVATAAVTSFICANCAHAGQVPDPSGRSRPTVPDFAWPFDVQEVLVPCTGRLQPEHVLKAFERGADLVLTVSCGKDECGYLQGSERWMRRADYLRAILDEIGLGGQRLLHFSLPSTSTETGQPGAARMAADLVPGPTDSRVAAIREAVMQVLDTLTPNPLCAGPIEEVAGQQPYQQFDMDEEANED